MLPSHLARGHSPSERRRSCRASLVQGACMALALTLRCEPVSSNPPNAADARVEALATKVGVTSGSASSGGGTTTTPPSHDSEREHVPEQDARVLSDEQIEVRLNNLVHVHPMPYACPHTGVQTRRLSRRARCAHQRRGGGDIYGYSSWQRPVQTGLVLGENLAFMRGASEK